MGFAETYNNAEQRDEFWADLAILEFTTELSRAMKTKCISKADLARKLGTSQAYITKIFRGNANLSISSLVKLSRAVGERFYPHVAPEEAHFVFFNTASVATAPKHWASDCYHTVSSQGSMSNVIAFAA